MEVSRSGITGVTPQRYGISNGLGASLYRCVAWPKPYRLVLRENCTEVEGSIFDQEPPPFLRGRCRCPTIARR